MKLVSYILFMIGFTLSLTSACFSINPYGNISISIIGGSIIASLITLLFISDFMEICTNNKFEIMLVMQILIFILNAFTSITFLCFKV